MAQSGNKKQIIVVNGQPVGSILHSELELAIRRYERAQIEFSTAISLPKTHPDRPGRIKRAAEIEASARNELWLSLKRLDDFNIRGIVPELSATYPPRGLGPVCANRRFELARLGEPRRIAAGR